MNVVVEYKQNHFKLLTQEDMEQEYKKLVEARLAVMRNSEPVNHMLSPEQHIAAKQFYLAWPGGWEIFIWPGRGPA